MTDATAPLERNRYFLGKLMTVEDFERDQAYFLQALAELRLSSHGPGRTWGLELSLAGEGDSLSLQVSEGLAIDRRGRALRLSAPRQLVLDPDDDRTMVLLHYREAPGQPVPALESGAVTGGVEYGLVQELAELSLVHRSKEVRDSVVLGLLERDTHGVLTVWQDTGPSRLSALSWPHGGSLTLDQLRQADWTVTLTFHAALQPARGLASGPQERTCRVALEHPGTGCRVSVLREVRLEDDGHQLQLVLDAEALTTVADDASEELWLHVSLSLDFLLDTLARPVIARLVGGELPGPQSTGGGRFESWFRITEDALERGEEETTRD